MSTVEITVPVSNGFGTTERTTVRLKDTVSGKFVRKPKPPAPPISVYMLSSLDGKWQKIGMSSSPNRRLTELNVPFDLMLVYHIPVENARTVETKLHAHFGDRYVKGEWFTGIGREEFVNAVYRVTDNHHRVKKCEHCGNALLEQ